LLTRARAEAIENYRAIRLIMGEVTGCNTALDRESAVSFATIVVHPLTREAGKGSEHGQAARV